MHCINCGSELDPNAKFCSYCGTKMPSEQKQPEAEIEPAAEVPTRAIDEPAPEQSNTESLPTTSNAPMGSEAISENTNLKAAVQQNKKRSRRHVPIIVLVAFPRSSRQKHLSNRKKSPRRSPSRKPLLQNLKLNLIR